LKILADIASDRWGGRVESVANLLEHGFKIVLVTHGSNVVENGKKEIEKLVEALPAD
jgi:hypothetical protein